MNKYWFRKRRGLLSRDMGWGWTPISIEGWILVLGMIALIVVGTLFMVKETMSTTDIIKYTGFLVIVIGFSAILGKKKSRD